MIRLAPPEPEATPEKPSTATVAAQVLGAQTIIEAVLHRLRLPLDQAEALEAGQMIPLPGVTVASVRVEGGGRTLGPARLGQVAGLRAIRLEAPLAPDLEELPGLREPPADLPLLSDDG